MQKSVACRNHLQRFFVIMPLQLTKLAALAALLPGQVATAEQELLKVAAIGLATVRMVDNNSVV